MPQGDKSSYTDRQKRQATHIEASYKKKGFSTKNAEARAWATVNKLSGGGKKSGSGRNSNQPLISMPTLTSKEISLHLKAVPEWMKRAGTIYRTFTLDGFPKSITFVQRIAKLAQKINHHPDIDIRFDKVTLRLTTHDQGGLTEKDFTLARNCDEAFSKLSEA